MTAHNLQGSFAAALAKIGTADMSSDEAKRHTPISQRDPAATREQTLENAASVLRTLWSERGNQR